MPVEIVNIANLLNEKGVQAPRLTALVPDCELYSCALFQPVPNIDFADEYVRNSSAEHLQQMEKFLELLEAQNINLGVTPEYSFPWSILESCFRDKRFPSQGNVWVFGGESISYNNLIGLKEAYEAENFIFEVGAVSNPEVGNFVDPACYLFRTEKNDGSDCYVVFVQCKTTQMGDRNAHFFERNNLQKGSTIFELKNRGEESISLFTLICSDVLGVEELHQRFRSRCLLLNIQLNDSPRHDSIVTFKKAIYRRITENNEIVCLNWGRNIRFSCGGQIDQKNNPSSSAIYSNSEKFDHSFTRLNNNHFKGLYFNYWDSTKCSVLYLNYDPGVFYFRNTKCWQIDGTPTQQGITGPESLSYFKWNEETLNWNSEATPDDSFSSTINGVNGDFADLMELKDNPIFIEMVLALTFGETSITSPHDNIKNNHFLKLTEPEAPSRITFAQDCSEQSTRLREDAISNFGFFSNLLKNKECFPIQIKSLFNNLVFSYKPKSPNYNLYSSDGTEKATVIFLGFNVPKQRLERVFDNVKAKLLDNDDDAARLIAWYLDGTGEPKFYPSAVETTIDDVGTEHPATIDGDGE